MSTCGDITCELCGAIYDKKELHICGQNAVVDLSRLRQRVEELEGLMSGRAAENPGDPFWKGATREELLDLARFQSGTTKALQDETYDLRQRVKELEAERETIPFAVLDMTPNKFIAMKKDAERYRWIKRINIGRPCFHLGYGLYATGSELDAAIDAAMEADNVHP